MTPLEARARVQMFLVSMAFILLLVVALSWALSSPLPQPAEGGLLPPAYGTPAALP